MLRNRDEQASRQRFHTTTRRAARSLSVTASVLTVLAIGLHPSAANACTPGEFLMPEQLDERSRRSFASFENLFEAEIISVEQGNHAMMVRRVFKGGLKPGFKVAGDYHGAPCGRRDLRVGDIVYVLIDFGPGGPTFPDQFLSEEQVRSFRRIGIIPEGDNP